MAYNTPFDAFRPLGFRVVDIHYVSPPVCDLSYYHPEIVPVTGEGEGDEIL
jgi:hypothetical protein